MPARAKVDGPLAIVTSASGALRSTGEPVGSRPSGLYSTWRAEEPPLPVKPPSVGVGAVWASADPAPELVPRSDDATTRPATIRAATTARRARGRRALFMLRLRWRRRRA